MPLAPRIVRQVAGDRQRLADVVELAQADLARVELMIIFEPAQMQGEQEPLLQFESHVGQLGLGELEGGQRPIEHGPVAGVGQRGLQAVPGRPERAEDDAEPGLVQTRQRAAQPGHLGQHRVAGSRTSSSTSSAVTEARSDSSVLDRCRGEARRVGRHHETSDACSRLPVRLGSSPSSVWAQTTATSATEPLVIHILVPFNTQSAFSPRRPGGPGCASRPGWSRNRPRSGRSSRSPRRRPTAAASCCFCSSLPNFQIANMASDPCTETMLRTPESPASSSRQARP